MNSLELVDLQGLKETLDRLAQWFQPGGLFTTTGKQQDFGGFMSFA